MKKIYAFFLIAMMAVTASAADSDYLRGCDISMLNYVENLGAKFYDANGTEDDALDIMQANGVNIVRLRLFNNPGTTVTYKTGSNGNTTNKYRVPEGYLDETDVLSLAKRAKAHGMKIELTFHYSDFWTNGTMQIKPSGWENYTFTQLKQAVYDYTLAFLKKMNNQGTTPDYVSLGNEIQSGLLFGYYNGDGSTTSVTKAQINSVNGYCDNMSNVAALLSQGSAAVREACPDAKVIVHLTMGSNVDKTTYKWFFDEMESEKLDYDIIGASYYPYWTNSDPSIVDELATYMYSLYSKPTLIMETGYSWTQYRPSGRYGGNYEGQLSLNGTAYNEATEAGQKSFIQALQTTIKGNSHLLGYLYWDPVMVEQQVNSAWIETCWAQKNYNGTWYSDGNLVGNTTWFDYDGKALSVFEAIAEDMVTEPTTDEESYDTATEGTYYYGSNCKAIGLADGTVAIVQYWPSDGQTEVTFPATIQVWNDSEMTAEYEVSQVGAGYAFYFGDSSSSYQYNGTITSLVFSEGIKSIAASSFYEMTSLTSLTLPASMTSIGGWSFTNCDALETITSYSTSITLGTDALRGKSSWDYIAANCVVRIPDGCVENYAAYTFDNTQTWSYWDQFYLNCNIHELTYPAITTVGYATYYNKYGFTMPEGVEGYIVTGTYEGKAYLAKIYDPGDEVYAGLALVLKSTTDLTEKTWYTVEALASNGNTATWPTDAEGNTYTTLLNGTQTAATTTYWGTESSDYYYYRLANNADYGLGWYFGAEDGAAFTNGAHKAYLMVSKSADSNRFISMFEDGPTGIAEVDGMKAVATNTCYDLSGRRISTPTNGLYIVNGKKFIVK